MTLQEDSKPGRTRREGNVVHIQTEFAARVRFMVISLAKREAREAVKRQLRAEGKVKVWLHSAAEINSLANAYLKAHAAELLAKAEASGTVRNLTLMHKRGRPEPQRLSLFINHAQNGASK
jgi:hypothetical protein